MLKQPTEYLDSLETMMALRATESKSAFARRLAVAFLTICFSWLARAWRLSPFRPWMRPIRDVPKLRHYLLGSGRANRFDGQRLRVGKIMTLKVERHIDQRNHHRHFHQGPDHSREGGSGVDAKY